jgi:hypothetical protein
MKMKTTRILLTCITVAAALLSMSPTGVSAKTLTIKMSPGQLRGVCSQDGGSYGSNSRGDGMCMGQGGVVICHKDKVCTDGSAKMEVSDGIKTIQPASTDLTVFSPSTDEHSHGSVKANLAATAMKHAVEIAN